MHIWLASSCIKLSDVTLVQKFSFFVTFNLLNV